MVRSLLHSPGDVVQVGAVLAEILSPDADEAGAAEHEPPGASSSSSSSSGSLAPGPAPAALAAGSGAEAAEGLAGGPIQTSPAVRRLAAEQGIPLAAVAGTGPGGRITKGDLLAYQDTRLAAAAPAAAAASHAAPAVAAPAAAPEVAPREAGQGPKGTVSLPLRGYRRAMLRSMTAAGAVPHFHLCDEVCMDALVGLREGLRGDPALNGGKLTFLPFFLKVRVVGWGR